MTTRVITRHSTHMPEFRTWYKTLRALFHLSTLLDARQSFRAFSMRSMSSCFFPDLLSIVQHSSLNPAMICLRRSTVLCLTLTLRPYGIIVRVTQCRTEGKRALPQNHPRDRRRTWRRTGKHGLARRWPRLALAVLCGQREYTTPNIHT
jgi:hypothetical protein